MVEFVTAEAAIEAVRDGDTIMVGGFGLSGAPLRLIDALARSGRRNLTIISNNLGEPGKGLGLLLLNGQVRKAIGSFFTSNPDVVRYYREGKIEIELLPQGTLAEAIRAGGAGVPAFYTPTGAETDLARDKEIRRFGDKLCVLEHSLHADVALIKAHRADQLGNLTYRTTGRNFNPAMATAGRLVLAEVDAIVPTGGIAPDEVITPHIYVDRIVGGKEGSA